MGQIQQLEHLIMVPVVPKQHLTAVFLPQAVQGLEVPVLRPADKGFLGDAGLHEEPAGQLIQAAPILHGSQQGLIKGVPPHLRVGVHIGVEILQIALAGEEHGVHVPPQQVDVRDIPGGNVHHQGVHPLLIARRISLHAGGDIVVLDLHDAIRVRPIPLQHILIQRIDRKLRVHGDGEDAGAVLLPQLSGGAQAVEPPLLVNAEEALSCRQQHPLRNAGTGKGQHLFRSGKVPVHAQKAPLIAEILAALVSAHIAQRQIQREKIPQRLFSRVDFLQAKKALPAPAQQHPAVRELHQGRGAAGEAIEQGLSFQHAERAPAVRGGAERVDEPAAHLQPVGQPARRSAFRREGDAAESLSGCTQLRQAIAAFVLIPRVHQGIELSPVG